MTRSKVSKRKRDGAGTEPERDARFTLEREIGRAMGGSKLDDFNAVVGSQALRSLWTAHSSAEDFGKQRMATIAAMIGIAPKDELEGMLAAQMVATHSAAMECFRRAMLKEQPFACWREQVSLGSKLVRSYTLLMEALDRHRGKGQPQVVRVERVTVEAGGQAIVGAVAQGGGGAARSQDRPHAKQVGHAPEPALRGQEPEREPVPVAGGAG
jgi:hypothetical protein